MDLHPLFINKYGRLRSGWRFAVFALLYLVLQFIINSTVFLALSVVGRYVQITPYDENVIFRLVLLGSALLAGYICTRKLEGLPWRALGLTLHRNWWGHFLWGSVIGSCSLLLAVSITAIGGGVHFTLTDGSFLLILRALLSSAALFIGAALAEEALFRGYPLQTFCRAHLWWLGLLLTSVPFAAVHLNNPNVVRGLTFLNTTLAGVWFVVAYLRTRSLWFPWGLHWSWNWMLDAVVGLPVSGMRISAPSLFTGSDLGPRWLTGGSYGIEGGVAATVALVVSTIIVWRIRSVKPDPELLALTSHENPKAANVSAIPSPISEPQINANYAD